MKRPSLRLALVFYVVVPLSIAAGVAGYFALRMAEARIEERLTEEVQLVARAIRLPVSRALEEAHANQVREALASIIGINRVYSAYVYNSEGTTVASAGVQNRTPDRRRLSALAAEGDRQGTYEKIAGRTVYSYFVPLTTPGGRTIGLLHVTRRARDIQASMTRLRWQVGGVLLAAIVLMAGLVLYGHHGAVGKYLNRLGASMTRVEQGARTHRAPLDGPREIVTLSKALNTMLDSIARAEEEIETRSAVQQALEQQLKHAEKLAALGQLAAGVAHELGTPLSVLDGKAQQALRKADLPDEPRRALEEIRKEVRRMEHIVRQLLDFGRKQALHRRHVDADRLAEMAVRALDEEIQTAGVTLTIDGPKPAPTLWVDPIRIEQALTNLLRNAIEATPGGHVVLSWLNRDDTVEFRVDDDGPGIDDAAAPHLFEPFFTTKGVGKGTGLGLAVVHGIADEHEGTITAGRSELGGARFCLALPHHTPVDEPIPS